ncbi:L-asparaginase ii protein [Lasiodiplodia theobromae]|uniref:L-asparaginase ii protein n=1 Tax=Lasiodiplodia theobromae TaxID=45133 RepID=UPI0015C4040E|nr:L-asparaginase ii protein [Lasiodiplodia theobromae]KAF4536458.1 L-asparaginase ii protein [Lasiodiplodia theobromae]
MTKTPTPAAVTDVVITDRGGIIENRHLVHAAVVDISSSSPGRILYAIGNPHRPTLFRSAAKPAQALAILETGGFDACGFSSADLALVCASHSSEARHVQRARAMLAAVSPALTEADLRCGGHPAVSEKVNRGWIKSDFVPGPLCNNCSGKHVGMIAGARALGAEVGSYHLPEHPMQVRVRRAVEELCGGGGEEDGVEVRWATDGCNLPAPAAPLHTLARNYAVFAAAADEVAAAGETGDVEVDARKRHMARIFNAMARHPEQVGGEGRFCTVLMEAFGGALIGKIGADGCYGVGVRASEQTKRLGAEGAIGIAVKIEDGSIEILYAVVAELLEQLQIGTPEMREKLAVFHHLKRLNTAQVVTGKVSLPFKVRPWCN